MSENIRWKNDRTKALKFCSVYQYFKGICFNVTQPRLLSSLKKYDLFLEVQLFYADQGANWGTGSVSGFANTASTTHKGMGKGVYMAMVSSCGYVTIILRCYDVLAFRHALAIPSAITWTRNILMRIVFYFDVCWLLVYLSVEVQSINWTFPRTSGWAARALKPVSMVRLKLLEMPDVMSYGHFSHFCQVLCIEIIFKMKCPMSFQCLIKQKDATQQCVNWCH